jgi:transitional endoplasmic reticulum ATPase
VLNGMKSLAESQASSNREIFSYLGLTQAQDLDYQSDAGQLFHKIILMHRHAEQDQTIADFSTLCNKNLDKVARQLRLDRVEAKILDFAVNAHFNQLLCNVLRLLEAPTFYNICGLLAALLNEFEHEIRSALSPKGRLFSTGLLELQFNGVHRQDFDDIFTFMSPTLVERMTRPLHSLIDLLDGVATNTLDATLDITDFEYMQDDLRLMIMHFQKSFDDHREGANILLYGPPGTGKTELSKLVAKSLGCELIEVAYESRDGYSLRGERRLRAFKLCQAFFAGSRTVILFDEMDDALSGELDTFLGSAASPGKGTINQVIERAAVPSIWVTNHINQVDPAIVRRFNIVLKMKQPGRRQTLKAIAQACSGWMDPNRFAHLADVEQLSPATLIKAINVVRHSASCLTENEQVRFVDNLIDQSLRGQRLPGLAHAMHAEKISLYDPAVLNADVDLLSLASGLVHFKSARICLYGPPGTGKTEFARWLSEHLDMPLIIKRASDLLGSYLGQTEHKLAEAFSHAEQQSALLLIDEIDTLLFDRKQAAQSWQVSMVNEMLTQMESYRGILIATTNLPESLDHASLRRFDVKVKLDYLCHEKARQMLLSLCNSLDLPNPSALHEAALKRIKRLTPGDFATVARQQRFVATRSVDQLLSSLRKESGLKIVDSVQVGPLN